MTNKLWYAVQHGDNYDWDNGSFDLEEAKDLANKQHEWHPGEEIRIITIEEGNDPTAVDEEVIFEAE